MRRLSKVVLFSRIFQNSKNIKKSHSKFNTTIGYIVNKKTSVYAQMPEWLRGRSAKPFEKSVVGLNPTLGSSMLVNKKNTYSKLYSASNFQFDTAFYSVLFLKHYFFLSSQSYFYRTFMCLEQSWLLHRTFNPEEVIPRWVRDPEGTQNSQRTRLWQVITRLDT